jgi:(p)ppGpp synthase/HD superfamily hydrolase
MDQGLKGGRRSGAMACSSATQRRGAGAVHHHPLEVATLVAEATGGTDQDLVIAALLHDAIEDCEVPRELIAKTFGTEIANLVVEVTDDKNLAKGHRKDMQAETAYKKSPRAKVLKLADKTSNLRALAISPAPDLVCAAELEYISWARKVVAGLRGTNEMLEKQFDEAAQAAERSLIPAL